MELVDLNGMWPTAGVTAAIGAELGGQTDTSTPSSQGSSAIKEAANGYAETDMPYAGVTR